jgi:hypothetical protein
MRSPGVIYRKYRQVKRKLMYLKISESFRKDHHNCSYGHYIKYKDNDNRNRTAKICMFGVFNDPASNNDYRKMDVCTCASKCNAFAAKRTRKEIIESFEKEISNSNVLQAKYPELAAYKWVLDKDLDEAKKKPGIINTILISLISFFEKAMKVFS